MTPPPLPPGVEGHPVCPDIHTGATDEPERDGWTDEAISLYRDEIDRLNGLLDIAVNGLRKMRDYYQEGSTATVKAYVVGRDLSMLLYKIGDAS